MSKDKDKMNRKQQTPNGKCYCAIIIHHKKIVN